jgi:hypothetical protein
VRFSGVHKSPHRSNSAALRNLQYTERDNSECYYVLEKYPKELEKKVTLLRYFRAYMTGETLGGF